MFYDLLRCLRNICVVVELTRCGNVRGWRICLFVAPLMPSFLPVNAKPFWFLWFYNANIWPRRCSICSFFCSFPVPPHFFFFSVVLSFFHSVPQKCFLFMCQRSDDSNLLVFLINLGIISSYHFPYNFLQTFGGFLHVTPAEFVQFILQNLRASKSPRYGSSPKQSYDYII